MSKKPRDDDDLDAGARSADEPTQQAAPAAGGSINEPAGSEVFPGAPSGGGEPAEPPVILGISPDEAEVGEPDLVMTVTGTGFTADAVIVFNGGVEPTEHVSSSELSTVVRPSTATVAGDFPVTVRAGGVDADPMTFTFTEPVADPASRSKRKR